jgi:hypothetical protein
MKSILSGFIMAIVLMILSALMNSTDSYLLIGSISFFVIAILMGVGVSTIPIALNLQRLIITIIVIVICMISLTSPFLFFIDPYMCGNSDYLSCNVFENTKDYLQMSAFFGAIVTLILRIRFMKLVITRHGAP